MKGKRAKTVVPDGYRPSDPIVDNGLMCSNCTNSRYDNAYDIKDGKLTEYHIFHCWLRHPARRIKGYWICNNYKTREDSNA